MKGKRERGLHLFGAGGYYNRLKSAPRATQTALVPDETRRYIQKGPKVVGKKKDGRRPDARAKIAIATFLRQKKGLAHRR